jgi:glycerol uptake facilitator-like aquaporin
MMHEIDPPSWSKGSYPGIASQASFFINGTEPAFGSILQIGFAYAIGIAFAIITCGPTSGGHFNPAITICFAIWQGFPGERFRIISLRKYLGLLSQAYL